MDVSLLVLTDRTMTTRPLLEVVAAAAEGGARTFVLREKDLPAPERFELAEAMRALGVDVIVAGPDPLGGNAVHLAAADPWVDVAFVGRSCHSVAALEERASYCTLSPIFPTLSKPGYGPALGTGVLGPGIVALGGVDTVAKARLCREAGAAGVAVMGAVMRAEDPASVVKGLLL